MKKLLLLILLSIIAAYTFSGKYNQTIMGYEFNRFIKSDLDDNKIIEGKHFYELGSLVTESTDDILILITYNSDSSMLLDYELSKDKEIHNKISYLHAVHNEEWRSDAKLFFNLKKFSLEKKSIRSIFKIYHEENKLSKLKLNNYLTEINVHHVPFWNSHSSLHVAPIFKNINKIEKNTKTEGFPLIIVKGKYLIKPWMYESYKHIPKVINKLLEK